uniref:Snail family transcriptional repressor 3 n=1 Tax=Sphenodon punctatus TaxID=8508 RepID=A0A8D0L5N7_SPHPU
LLQSFLVGLSFQTPETAGSCHSCWGLVLPLLLQDDLAPSAPCDAARLWDHSSVLSRLSIPLLQDNEIKGGDPGTSPQISLADTLTSRVPAAPLRDSQNSLKLPSVPSLPQRRLPDLGSTAEGDGEKLQGGQSVGAYPLGRFECFNCHKSYHTFSGLARHRHQRCELQARRYFSCKYCDKEYASLGALKMHIRTHTLPCVCKICGKAFSRPWLLQGHIRTHTGEKPYACSHCSRAFADRSNLRAHLQTHSEIKKYQCRSCSKTFSRMSLLSRHEEAGCCPAS